MEIIEKMFASKITLLLEILQCRIYGFFFVSDKVCIRPSNHPEELSKNELVSKSTLTIGGNKAENNDSSIKVGSSKASNGILRIIFRSFFDHTEGQVETAHLSKFLVLFSHLWCDNHEDVGNVWVCLISQELGSLFTLVKR